MPCVRILQLVSNAEGYQNQQPSSVAERACQDCKAAGRSGKDKADMTSVPYGSLASRCINAEQHPAAADGYLLSWFAAIVV
jgi:hypothetical protein